MPENFNECPPAAPTQSGTGYHQRKFRSSDSAGREFGSCPDSVGIKKIQILQNKIQKEGSSPANLRSFKRVVWSYYKKNRRNFSWRNTDNPYHIVVSEIMLQQTQTKRVEQKYPEWIKCFPDWERLALAPLKKILLTWQGMGYNRRAIALKACALKVTKEYGGHLPSDFEVLKTFPHIGFNTAGSIFAFAFNRPTVFLETNIRSVFIFFFFEKKKKVLDQDILRLVEKTLDKKNPKEWYSALMDFGAFLKKEFPNPNRKSKHYSKQSKFEGSNRQMRGLLLKLLSKTKGLTEKQIRDELKLGSKEIKMNLENLKKEGFITKKQERFMIVS